MPSCCVNALTCSAICGSSMVKPTISTPLSLNLLCSAVKSGISRRQGPHQVAQKLTSTTLLLPTSSLSLTLPPLSIGKLISPALLSSLLSNLLPDAQGRQDKTVAASRRLSDRPISENRRNDAR